jgi:DNA invertase Pin-like site-specific DNA recombinase
MSRTAKKAMVERDNSIIRTVGYIRVSTEDQAKEGVSLANQQEKIAGYCKLKDMTLLQIVADEGMSAKNIDGRPGLKKVLAMVGGGEIDAIVVYKLDRMFRNTVDALQTTKEFDEHGVAFHSINETIDTKSAMGRFFFTLMAALGEMERALISERITSAMQHMKTTGQRCGMIPYGMQAVIGPYNATKKKSATFLVPNLEEQKIIVAVMIHRWSGAGYNEIARRLNSAGLRTRTGNNWEAKGILRIVEAEEKKQNKKETV